MQLTQRRLVPLAQGKVHSVQFDAPHSNVGHAPVLQVRVVRESQRIDFVIISVCWGRGNADGRTLSRGEVPLPMRRFARGLVDVAGAERADAARRQVHQVALDATAGKWHREG